MIKLRISLALMLFALMTVQIPCVWGTDKGGSDKDQTLLLQKSFPTESGERLKVNAYAGDVKINPWNNNQIEIKIYGSSEASQYLSFDVSTDELGINIAASKKEGLEMVGNPNLRYEISVPWDYDVRVTTTGRNVIIEDKTAPVEISTKR